jgi:hypothetical protein
MHNSPKGIDQKPLPCPEPSVVVQGPNEQTTPRRSTTNLSQLEYSIPNTSDASIGGSTLAHSTEAFETAVNSTSEVSLTTQATAIKGPQSVDREISNAISGQSAMRLPRSGYTFPHIMVPSVCHSARAPSTKSFETAVNTFEVSTQPASVTRPQSVDHGISHVTSRQPPERLPQPEYSIPNISVSSIGGSTRSPSVGSFETPVGASEVPPSIRAAVKRPSPRCIDSGINQTTLRQFTTPQPLLEISNPKTNVPSVGGNTLFSPSLESLETLVNTSEVSLSIPVVTGKPPYSVDSGIFDQTTPRQTVTRLPQVEYTDTNTNVLRLGGNTLFASLADSFETLVNTSEVSFPTAAGKRPQSVDSGIDLQVEAPTSDTLSTPPTSAPPASLLVTIPSSSPAQARELQSAPPVRKWEAHGNWFEKFKYDYETESWIPRQS